MGSFNRTLRNKLYNAEHIGISKGFARSVWLAFYPSQMFQRHIALDGTQLYQSFLKVKCMKLAKAPSTQRDYPVFILRRAIASFSLLIIRIRYDIWFPSAPNSKTRLFKNIEIFTTKNCKFDDKNSDIFHISAQNIDCGCSLESPRRGRSNEYPHSMFSTEIRKLMYTPVNPILQYKNGVKGGQTYIGVFLWCGFFD